MTEHEARTVMKAHGWTYLPRARRGKIYIYAERKEQGKKVERYICSLASLDGLTADEFIRLLTK